MLYYVFDDFPPKFLVNIYKIFLGCQSGHTVTDKYFGKLDLPNRSLPSIFLFNIQEYYAFRDLPEVNCTWLDGNVVSFEVENHLLLPQYQ